MDIPTLSSYLRMNAVQRRIVQRRLQECKQEKVQAGRHYGDTEGYIYTVVRVNPGRAGKRGDVDVTISGWGLSRLEAVMPLADFRALRFLW